jgi:hypothetical protein
VVLLKVRVTLPVVEVFTVVVRDFLVPPLGPQFQPFAVKVVVLRGTSVNVTWLEPSVAPSSDWPSGPPVSETQAPVVLAVQAGNVPLYAPTLVPELYLTVITTVRVARVTVGVAVAPPDAIVKVDDADVPPFVAWMV